MKEQTNYDYEKYVQIAKMAKMGWWESDLKNQEYICSDFIVDLLGLESNRITFTEFHQRIREDHRLRLKNEYLSLSNLETYEQMFPMQAKNKEIWVYSKICFQKPNKEGDRNMVGYLQCIDRPIDDPNKNIDFLQVNSLLYQQNSISYSLLAFLQCDDIPQVINRILGDILKQFRGDRTYIVEIDRKKQVQNCTYESTAKGVSEERDNLQNILWDDSFWWNRQITDRKSIILNTLDDMPLEAQEYRNLLEVQNIKSLMAVPLIAKDEVWGYMGIDMVSACRSWSNIDLQWFSSLANIISICIELRKSELQAKEDRLALDNSEKILRNIYKNLPAGVELYDCTCSIVAFGYNSLKVCVTQRMIFCLYSQSFIFRIHGRAFRYHPTFQHSIHFQTKIEMKMTGFMLLDNKNRYPAWSLHGIRHRFRSLTELSFCPVLFEVVKRGVYLLFYHLCTFPFIGRILCHSLYFFR